MAVKACSVLAVQCEGMKITDVEGLEVDGKLAPIQKAFLDEGAYQCGFCTSGMLMSSQAFIDETKGTPTEMADQRKHRGQHLPVHRLQQHRPCHRRCASKANMRRSNHEQVYRNQPTFVTIHGHQHARPQHRRHREGNRPGNLYLRREASRYALRKDPPEPPPPREDKEASTTARPWNFPA